MWNNNIPEINKRVAEINDLGYSFKYPFRELRAARPKQKSTGNAGGSQKLIEKKSLR